MNIKDEINRINQIAITELRFSDLSGLKSGWDEFSNMALPDLCEAVGPNVIAQVTDFFTDDPESQARVYRWVLRGLEVTPAIVKVHQDCAIAAKAREARGKKSRG